jgi:hypothetical protein
MDNDGGLLKVLKGFKVGFSMEEDGVADRAWRGVLGHGRSQGCKLLSGLKGRWLGVWCLLGNDEGKRNGKEGGLAVACG